MASIGILPFLATEHINITLANKLFDYMASALPIVASDVVPMRRVLSETEAGVLFPAGDAVSPVGLPGPRPEPLPETFRGTFPETIGAG